jgi:nucleoside-diphosphate-sugar epimerase
LCSQKYENIWLICVPVQKSDDFPQSPVFPYFCTGISQYSMSEVKKCIVTGGAGFIGSHLTDRLLGDGHTVTVIDDFSSGKMENLQEHLDNPQLTVLRRSILDDGMEEIFAGASVIFHVAAVPRVQYSIQYPELTNRANIEGTLRVLEASRKTGAGRVVYSSSSSVYGNQKQLPLTETMAPNPMSPYALQKLTGEYYCRLYHSIFGLETISLRYFNVYGPKQDPLGGYANLIPRSVHRTMNGQPPVIFGDGLQTRDFTFVEDVIEANILASLTVNERAFGEAINIGGGSNLSVNEVVAAIIRDTSIKPDHQPPVVEPKDTLADIGKARQILGWEPRVPFSAGIIRTIQSYK